MKSEMQNNVCTYYCKCLISFIHPAAADTKYLSYSQTCLSLCVILSFDNILGKNSGLLLNKYGVASAVLSFSI